MELVPSTAGAEPFGAPFVPGLSTARPFRSAFRAFRFWYASYAGVPGAGFRRITQNC